MGQGAKRAGFFPDADLETAAPAHQEGFVRHQEVRAAGDPRCAFEHALREQTLGFIAQALKFADARRVAEELGHQRDQPPYALKRGGAGVEALLRGVGHAIEDAACKAVSDRSSLRAVGAGRIREIEEDSPHSYMWAEDSFFQELSGAADLPIPADRMGGGYMTLNSDRIEELGPVPLMGTQRFKVWSEAVGDHFVIDVHEPLEMMVQAAPAPVLFMTDGNLCFPAASGISGMLAMEPDGPPPQVVVGVGYEVSGRGERAEHHKLRARDLTPCGDARLEAMMRQAPPPFTWDDSVVLGGADRFLDFLLDELSPWVAERFHVDPAQRTLAGVSMGGLFALHTLFSRPDAFGNYIACSPSVWWADRLLVQMEESYAQAHEDLDAGLYMAVGELEEAQDPNAKMVSNFRELVGSLEGRGYPSLRLTHDVLAGETHMSAFDPAFSRALRALLKPQARSEDWAHLGET